MTTNDATTPVSTCTMIGSFNISDDEVCEILAFHQSNDRGLVGGRTILARGKADQASMDEAAFQKFWEHRNKVPDNFACRHYFVFPEASDAIGGVRYADRGNGDWYHDYGSLDGVWRGLGLLVRFRRKRT